MRKQEIKPEPEPEPAEEPESSFPILSKKQFFILLYWQNGIRQKGNTYVKTKME